MLRRYTLQYHPLKDGTYSPSPAFPRPNAPMQSAVVYLASEVDPLLARVVEVLIMGLTTDGAHHKQYYLEAAFRALCTAEYVEKTKDKFQWAEGMPS